VSAANDEAPAVAAAEASGDTEQTPRGAAAFCSTGAVAVIHAGDPPVLPLVTVETVDQALMMVDRAYLALVEAVEFQSARQVRNLAVAAAAFAREAKDTRLLDKATELRTRAERKAGQMLRESAEAGERAKLGRPEKTSESTTFSAAPTLSAIGVTRDQSSKWQQVAALTDDEFEDALATTKAVTHDISTPKVLRAVQQMREREAPIVDTDEVAVLPPRKAPSPDEQATSFYNAVRALGELTLSASQLRDALPYYQHFRIAENIDRAVILLREVCATWLPAKEEHAHARDAADALLEAAHALRTLTNAHVSAYALMRVLTVDQQARVHADFDAGMRFMRNVLDWFRRGAQ